MSEQDQPAPPKRAMTFSEMGKRSAAARKAREGDQWMPNVMRALALGQKKLAYKRKISALQSEKGKKGGRVKTDRERADWVAWGGEQAYRDYLLGLLAKADAARAKNRAAGLPRRGKHRFRNLPHGEACRMGSERWREKMLEKYGPAFFELREKMRVSKRVLDQKCGKIRKSGKW